MEPPAPSLSQEFLSPEEETRARVRKSVASLAPGSSSVPATVLAGCGR